ncbi:hypothetical protein E1193_30440 [Micromonospora sp. KC606]|uniref:hypothetical protein n=1 Tax=Micromonospora sp. KC606 TaxID=2530379 RepID=UPI00104B09C7|nr:hypothetical protein [Micromonospora sp. KC606]TDC69639.1 hypothetical protein E1193_30440 [Micromonospora sp. KC606]
MIEFRIPAFRAGGEMVSLSDVLREVRPRGWSWRLLNFEGTFKTDSNLNALDLEQRIRASVEGLSCSWDRLLHFSDDVDQPIDVSLVASDGIGRCVLVIEVRDTTYWRILAEQSDANSIESATRISRLV